MMGYPLLSWSKKPNPLAQSAITSSSGVTTPQGNNAKSAVVTPSSFTATHL